YQVSSNGGSSWGTAVLTNSTSASATVTGLTNGTAYVFKVAGVNGVGTGSYSSASSSVTPNEGVPRQTWVVGLSTDATCWDQNSNNLSNPTVQSLTDGSLSTGAGSCSDATWIQIDLGQVRTISGIYLRGLTVPGYWSTGYSANRTLRISTNGSSWSNYATTGSAAELSNLQLYTSGGTVNCRFIQIYQPTPGWMAISEFYPRGN
ncbi:MAG: hypothetical protein EB078_09555, partial [Proteobacteria bacterium]|nr:hypothetical protein [Pseudomonadota bacterium]